MDELKPTPQLLIKLGSIIIHYQELLSSDGHYMDKANKIFTYASSGGKHYHPFASSIVGGDPVLAWMVDNVMITEDSFGFKKPDKKKSKAKIDGVMAMVMAASVWVSDSVMPTEAPGVMVL